MKGGYFLSIFGYPIEQIYLVALIISSVLIVLFMLFGDFLDAVGDLFNPTLILAFIIFCASFGLIFEKISSLSSGIIILISAVIALLLTTLLNVFILLPFQDAEHSLSYTEDSLVGRVGKLIVSVPENGFGEIFIESKSGMITKPAASLKNNPIAEGEQVLVLKVEKGVLYVIPYEVDWMEQTDAESDI